MLFTAVIAISLVSGCKQNTSDDNDYNYSGGGGGHSEYPADVAGWYKISWFIKMNQINLYLQYDGNGKLKRIGTAEKETSVDNIINDYGDNAYKLKDYTDYEPILKKGKITDPAQWPSWA